MSPLSDLFCGCSLPSRCPVSSTKIVGDAPLVQSVPGATSGADIKHSSCVAACFYEADPEDSLDVQLSSQLLCLERSFAMTLRIRRLGAGDYEVDGRRVKLNWAPDDDQGGKQEIFVGEAFSDDDDQCGITLAAYLQQAKDVSAYVAASLGGKSPGSPAVARVPADKRLSFVVAPHFASSRQVSDGIATDRLTCMRVACEEARLREHAAEAYERASAEGRGRNGLSPQPVRSASGASISASSSVASLRAPSPSGSVRVASPSPSPYQLGKPAAVGAAVQRKTAYDAAYVRSSSMPPPIPSSPTSPKEPWGRASTGNLPSRSKPPQLAPKGKTSSSLVVGAAKTAPRAYSRSPTPPPNVQVGVAVVTSVTAPAHRPYSRSPTPPQLPCRASRGHPATMQGLQPP